MAELLPPLPVFTAFLIASLVLAVTPGPGVLYIITRSIAQGRCCGVISVAGVALGNLGNALVASFGLAAVFAISSLAFTVVKYAGAVYLICLGVQMLRSPIPDDATSAPADAPLGRVFRDGFAVALLNPKTTIFFGAFLPQFVSVDASTMTRSFILGACFVVIAAVTDSLYALAAAAIAPALRRGKERRIGHYLGGGILVGLGIFAALSNVRAGK